MPSHEVATMNALSVGYIALQALPGLSPWIIPAIAIAAKRTPRPAKRANGAVPAKPARPAARVAARAPFRARREATPWSG